MKRWVAVASLLCAGPLFAQSGLHLANGSLATVTATQIVDASFSPLPSGTICFTPVDGSLHAANFGANGGGNIRAVPVCRNVVNGTMQAPTLQLVRSDMSVPVGVNYQIVVTDNSNGQRQTLGFASIATNPWSLDNWAPTTVQTAPLAAWIQGPPGSAAAVGAAGTVQVAGPGGVLAAATPAQLISGLGFTPANKAGDTFSGSIIVPGITVGGQTVCLSNGQNCPAGTGGGGGTSGVVPTYQSVTPPPNGSITSFTLSTGQTITMTFAPLSGDVLTAFTANGVVTVDLNGLPLIAGVDYTMAAASTGTSANSYQTPTQSPNGTNTTFTLSTGQTINMAFPPTSIDRVFAQVSGSGSAGVSSVFLNGVTLVPGVDYTVQ